ncbi:hypothetical protein GUITHDRAFT_118532 [Guillardia theta CCMP2712]|uniref:Uncharacterized protein n=1 Tax=Guillardia theta (strain CCMP2712) TaxID=905079 RepID=L1IGG0_GUITC|nr:hypothetical protein GUITHDRAFT_118532 [Guillardia theta CCMP2712]EKX35298.1 hypothetical protein GUITHDRAFT_118532 [Guillardia theta CCMP2712]|eukprot:XP_005822278.1 hypothetical protein GUITHDRAFT_118532 [Guillardia theta CCMP2712]
MWSGEGTGKDTQREGVSSQRIAELFRSMASMRVRAQGVDKISTLYDFDVSISLEQWLSLVKQESSRKAPLSRNWQSLPIDELRQLALERGMGEDSKEAERIKLVKFLREWDREYRVR